MKVNDYFGRFVYLAAPYSIGDKDANVRRSIDVAEKLMAAGALVYNPLLSHYHEQYHPHTAEWWYEYDLHWLLICDVLIYLDGESRGVKNEIDSVAWLNIEVVKWEG